ncbi:transcription termination/antitermination protein NusG, partial [Pseudomonas syringae group genomosp. 7]|uniref:transcription termination/antitermination protein NusG n=1 Tax=Pseudomonas syringae group genomosp. 7 TaxID=251699 RepID=UPI003770560F
RMAQAQDIWYAIRSTRGLSRNVTFAGQPVPVRDHLLEQIRQRLSTPAPKVRFIQGEPVMITTGSWRDVEARFLAEGGTERAV